MGRFFILPVSLITTGAVGVGRHGELGQPNRMGELMQGLLATPLPLIQAAGMKVSNGSSRGRGKEAP